MTRLDEITAAIVDQRKRRGLTQDQLASKARVSRLLIAKLETGRYPEIGVVKLLRILHVLGLDLRLTTLNMKRPTLEDLIAEDQKGETL